MGWVKGLEPSTLGTTIRCSNQLSYTHHIHVMTAIAVFVVRAEWQGRLDSNQRMSASKADALPLGDTPTRGAHAALQAAFPRIIEKETPRPL